MSLQSSLTALASAVRSKSGTDETLTIDEMTEKVNGIFPAFYSYMNGSGNGYLTVNQVPFECNLVSVMLRWGIGNLNSEDIYTVFYNGKTADSRYRKKEANNGNVPYNISNTVAVTNTPDSNGTYTVKIYCDGCVFNSVQQYIVFLAKKE